MQAFMFSRSIKTVSVVNSSLDQDLPADNIYKSLKLLKQVHKENQIENFFNLITKKAIVIFKS